MAIVLNQFLDQATYIGGVFVDQSGQGNNGTPANAPNFTTNHLGIANAAAIFVAANNDAITVLDSNTLDFDTNDFTIAIWAKSTGVTGTHQVLLSKDYFAGTSPANEYVWLFYLQGDGHIAFYWNNTFIFYSGGYVNDDTWHLFIIERDGDAGYIYVDNNQRAHGATFFQGASFNNNVNLLIGERNSTPSYFEGPMDNLRIYNHALSEAERTAIFTGKYERTFSGICTPSGALTVTPTFVIQLSGSCTPLGALSVSHPDWLLIDETLTWMGEWDVAWAYNIDEVVLYKSADGNEWHAFVSKIGHNVGNVPTSSAYAWRRLYQEKFL